MIELSATKKFPRCFKKVNGHFEHTINRTYYIRCDSPHITVFVFSDGFEELWLHDNWKLADCLKSVERGLWTEFSIAEEKEIIKILIRVTFSS